MHSNMLKKLEGHKRNLNAHFKKASESLVKCQIIEPYVEKGTLHGSVCPWEIGEFTNEGAFPICEDFHDTLEAIWVWTCYAKISSKQNFKPNIDWAWEYIVKNWRANFCHASQRNLFTATLTKMRGMHTWQQPSENLTFSPIMKNFCIAISQ
ncbi:MAG: hypothetical protein ACP5IM_06485 [Candidatus Bathyarchaeia archaeon]